MKTFVILIVVVLAIVGAEPPYYRNQKQAGTQEIDETKSVDQPLDPNPQGAAFIIPAKYLSQQNFAFAQQYREPYPAPVQYYIIPAQDASQFSARLQTQQYNSPQFFIPPASALNPSNAATTTTVAPETTESTTVDVTTESSETTTVSDIQDSDEKKSEKQVEDVESVENVDAQEGQYYLLLPNGQLQKIVYMTESDLEKMVYTARYQYENVEPLSGPIYTYNSRSEPLVQLFQ